MLTVNRRELDASVKFQILSSMVTLQFQVHERSDLNEFAEDTVKIDHMAFYAWDYLWTHLLY